MLLLIDNFDSFVHNLARYFRRLGQPTRVVRNDELTVAEIDALSPAAIVLSPGPCTPAEAGVCVELVKELHFSVPILGVCLGHQAIGAAFGADIVRAPAPVHGRHSPVEHDQQGLFVDIPNPTPACRYHSLVVDPHTLSHPLIPTAWSTDDRCLMALRHERLPVFGLQFHPESVLSPAGYRLLASFLRLADLPCEAAPSLYDERPAEPVKEESTGPPPLYY